MFLLDSQHRVISVEVLFRGTIDSASVYLEVLSLQRGYRSGDPEPSDANRRITERLKEDMG